MEKSIKKYIIGIVIVFVCVGMFSCKVGKKYTRPELNLPAALVEGGKDTVTYADMKWWEVYTDTTLQSLIRKALEYNKDMLIASARIKEMAAMKRISLANLLPQIDGTIYAEREMENYGGNNPDNANSFEGKLLFSWEIDLWGNLRWAREKSIAEYMQSIEAQRALKMTLIAEVAQAYFELVALDNELTIVRQTLANRQEGVRLAKLRFDGGLTSETSYQQAQVELARTATLVPELEQSIALKENDIAFLVGEYPHTIVKNIVHREIQLPDYLPVGLSSELLKRRPDIRQAEQQLIAANAQVGISFTDMFPRITLTGKYGLESPSLSDFLKSPYGFMSGTLLNPIFEAGKNIARYKAQRYAYEQECYRYEKSVLSAFREVNNAIVNFNKIKEVYVSRKKLEEAAKSYVDLAQLQYINGVTRYLDVLDAQRLYFDAQIGLSNAIRDERIAIVYLYKALGGGW
ncbi:efflux transporter outer membrane subunit [Coprobacter sp. LH1063]|uniref:Efflux transporter outer membrane subunit n=2 Tax=Coprobacter tertius TaxID=2944915 RepID=A0ABT1MI31_9BACT|nr:efflux transporter outer membrane subunit [Coprobacter tertius]MCP9612275.1 efflux transporter outer membrane subunit [Coprobacter tertius]